MLKDEKLRIQLINVHKLETLVRLSGLMGSRRRFIASVSSSEDDAESGLDVGGVTVRAPLLFHRGSAGGASGDRRSSSSETAAVAFTCQDALDQIGFGRWHVVLLCFSGMVWFSDAVAIMLLSHIGPAVRATHRGPSLLAWPWE